MGRLSDAWGVLTGKSAVMDATAFSRWIRTEFGTRKNVGAALQAYRESPRFRAVVQRIAESVALNQWEVYVTAENVSATHLRSGLAAVAHQAAPYRKMVRGLAKAGKFRPLVEVEPGHPLIALMRRPNQLRWGGTMEVMQANIDIVGHVYVWAKKGTGKYPVELVPISAAQVGSANSDGYQVTIGGESIVVPRKEMTVLYRPDPSAPFSIMANGLGMTLSDELDTDENAAKTAAARLRNRGVPDAIVTVDGADAAMIDRIEADMLAKYQGAEKRGKPHITNRKVDVQHIGEKMADLSLVELREFEARVMWTTFGVPPEILGLIENSNRATIDAAETIFARWVLWPRLMFLADWLQNDVAPMTDARDRILVVPCSPVPEDKEARDRVAKIAPWAPEINDWREWMGLDPKDDLVGLHWVPGTGKPATVERLWEMVEEDGAESPDAAGTDGADPESDPGDTSGDGEDGADDGEDGNSDGASEDAGNAGAGDKAAPHRKQDIDVQSRIDRVTDALQPERLTSSTSRLWEQELRAWMLRTARDVGATLSLDMINPLITPHLSAFGAERIPLIDGTTRQAIRDALVAGVQAGEGADALARRLRGVFSVARKRSVVIARTEVIRSSNWAATAAYRATGLVERREWLATPDGRTRDSHATMGGVIVPINAKFVLRTGRNAGAEADHPGGFGIAAEDVQCFSGDQVFESPSAVHKMFRRGYSGEFVRVTTEEGYQLSGTPNHPVLTARGWVALGSLNDSDHLIRGSVGQVGMPLGDHVDDGPSTFEQAFDLASVSGGAAAMRRCASGHQHFHGDGLEGEIDVVLLEGKLWNRVEASCLQSAEHPPLASPSSATRSLLGDSQTVSGDGGSLTPTDGIVGSLGELEPVLRAGLAHPEKHSLTPSADVSAASLQALPNGAPCDTEAFGNGLLAHAGLVDAADLLGIKFEAVPWSSGHRVVSVERVSFCGAVYNAETEKGWYICNGFIVHNCRCFQAPVVDELKRTDEERTKLWGEADSYATKWEAAAVLAFQRGFALQEMDVMAALAAEWG